MTRIRIRFSKTAALRFIGHLDLQRVFQQTVRRAGLPAAYSQGFNPHLLLSFALPLPLGMESVNDYADLTLERAVPEGEIVEKLNARAPGGLIFKSAYPAQGKAAALAMAADYALNAGAAAARGIGGILKSEAIIVPKKTKSGIKNTDIRPDILSLEASAGVIIMRLSAGSARFVNPMTVAELILGEKPRPTALTRLELYRLEGGRLAPL